MSITIENIGEKIIEHITPTIDMLTAIQAKIICQEIGCGKIFALPQNYRLHLAQCHQGIKFQAKAKRENYEEWYHCPIDSCRYTYGKNSLHHFSTKKAIKQHYLKVHAEKLIKCDKCEAKFSTHSFLKAHRISCGKDLTCSCGSRFSSIPSLQTHARRTQHIQKFSFKNASDKSTDSSANATRFRSIQPRIAEHSLMQPKPHQSHIVAAIALSELGVARIKRISTVDVGIQTESPQKRVPRRTSLSSKRKTIETQTHLTNLEKKKKSRKTRATSTSSQKQESCPYDFMLNGVTAATQTFVETELENVSNIYDTINTPTHNYDTYDPMTMGRSGSRNPSLGQIRSSSMETQTDLLLNSDILSDQNLWCSSETQTCENFSDIEQYLGTSTHTQTNENELFPELNFSHSETQTIDNPSFVDTQTQTLYVWSL